MTDQVYIKINGDSNGFQKASASAEKSSKALQSSMLSTAKVATASFLAIGTVISKQLIDAYAQQEQAEIRTRQTLESTGYAAGVTANELFNMASALQNVTTYGDEAILGGTNLLLTFKNIGETTFPRATEAMLDMATAMGTDLKSSAIQVGKALNDPATGLTMLTRVGITFTDQQKALIKSLNASGDAAGAQAVILTELESQFGGAAKAAASGTGSFIQIKNAIGDVAEKAGGALVTALVAVNEKLNLIGVANYWGRVLNGVTDAAKGSALLKSEISALDTEIAALNKSSKEGKDNWIYNNLGKYEQDTNRYADATSRRAELAKQLAATEKAEYKDSAEFKKKISDAATAQDIVDAAAAKELDQKKIDARVELNNAFVETEKEKNARLKEENGINIEGDIEVVQASLDAEAAVREQAKINELISKGEFEKAKSAIDKKALTDKKKLLATQLADRAAFLSAAVTLANSENIALATIGKAAALMQIAIATPPAVASSYRFGTTVGGPAGGAVAAGIAYTAMAAQAAQVAGIKGFSEGGIIPDGDDRVVGVKKREMVLTEQDQESLLNIIRGGENSGGSGGEFIFTFNDSIIADGLEVEFVQRSRENRTPIMVKG